MRMDPNSPTAWPRGTLAPVDVDGLPPQLQAVLRGLACMISSREPALQAKVDQLRARHPHFTNDQLTLELIRSTRRRVAGTGALSAAAAIAPGLGTVIAVGTVTSQAFYALEQEVELVLAVAMIYGHELATSDERVLVTGGERLAVAAFRRLPSTLLAHGGSRILARILARVAGSGAAKAAARLVPIGVGVAAGAGFDWLAVTGLGRAAMKYYGPGGPGARPLLLAGEDAAHVKVGG